MSFNLGLANHPISRMGGVSSVGVYLYEDIYYRQWITEIALAFYEGRQDEFVWLDLVRQFRNPEKQQILPINLTKEIIDEISVLYQEAPIYQVVDENGKLLKEDQKLWEQIMEDSRYHQLMDKIDRWCNLLGTVLVKVAFVDPDTGFMVEKNKGGKVQLDLLHGGVYDLKHGASPYYITEIMIGFGKNFGGFGSNAAPYSAGGPLGLNVAGSVPDPSSYGPNDIRAANKKVGSIEFNQVAGLNQLAKVNRIYWSPSHHLQLDENNNGVEVENPYGVVPAVPFFNQDPAHYYFLPINEPLLYANHACNMRITDLNHIAKFQSFGVPVLRGVERSSSTRHGRPVDDHNILGGGGASRFGGGSTGSFGPSGQHRNFDAGFGIYRDGNADANALGLSLGPDTAVAVGEKGDFKFAHPSADIMGLVKTIHAITDMIRINHGLRPKYDQQLPSSGFSILMQKIGVLENNVRRSRLFKEREQQLFQIIKKLWNVHHSKAGDPKFSEEAKLLVSYKIPEFPVDPKTKTEQLMMETKLVQTGDREVIKKVYPHLSEIEINKIIKNWRKDFKEQRLFEAEVEIERAKMFEDSGVQSLSGVDSMQVSHQGVKTTTTSSTQMKQDQGAKDSGVTKPKIDNKVKHSEESSKQKNRNGDPRAKKEEK